MAYTITPRAGEPFNVVLKGRLKWTLDRLRKAGATGCTSVSDPAPRLAAYVHSLREMGVEIETITEKHGGDYPGIHGRYVLQATVTPAIGGAA